jgi:hypothetical protein
VEISPPPVLGTDHRRRGLPPHALLIVPAAVCLLAGLDAALLLLDLPAPVHLDRLPDVHGMLLVLGFVGTLVALERSIALGEGWGFVAPLGLGAGGLALLSPADLRVGKALLVLGAGGLVVIYRRLWGRQPSEALAAQASGAVAAAGAAVLWLGEVDVSLLLPWLVAFVVLTVAGERVELARVVRLSTTRLRAFTATSLLLLVAAPVTLLRPDVGTPLAGAGLLGLVGWLATNDVARHTVRARGLPRYMAVCLLAGYAWLAVAGGLWLLAGPATDGPRYDAVVHAVFLGFTMSMIMTHAPVILPAVLGRPLPYRAAIWAPAALLHLSLVIRIGVGDVRSWSGWWRVGGVTGVTAVLGLAVLVVVLVAVLPRRTTSGARR